MVQRVKQTPDLDLIPKDVIQKHAIIPLSKVNDKLQLIIHDPLNLELLDLLRFRLNCELEPILLRKRRFKHISVKSLEKRATLFPRPHW